MSVVFVHCRNCGAILIKTPVAPRGALRWAHGNGLVVCIANNGDTVAEPAEVES